MPERDRLAAFEQYRAHLDGYEEQLRSLDDQVTYTNWVYRRDSPDAPSYEGAIGEAVAFAFLRDRVESARPLPTPEVLFAPDFRCEVGGVGFLVEVANRWTWTVTRPTDMPAQPEAWESRYLSRKWVRQIEETVRKANARAKDEELPRLILVPVLHQDATEAYCHRSCVEAILCESFQADGGPVPPDESAEPEVHIERALFAHSGDLTHPRYRSVSGFIQAGFGFYPGRASVHGGLNPSAAHPFDPALLADLPFATLPNWPLEQGTPVAFDWSDLAS